MKKKKTFGEMVRETAEDHYDAHSKPSPEMPANWEDCTKAQLEWLLEHGGYGQRMIAERYLRAISLAHRARLTDEKSADDYRAQLKAMGPNQPGEIQPKKFFDRYGDGVDYGDYG